MVEGRVEADLAKVLRVTLDSKLKSEDHVAQKVKDSCVYGGSFGRTFFTLDEMFKSYALHWFTLNYSVRARHTRHRCKIKGRGNPAWVNS